MALVVLLGFLAAAFRWVMARIISCKLLVRVGKAVGFKDGHNQVPGRHAKTLGLLFQVAEQDGGTIDAQTPGMFSCFE